MSTTSLPSEFSTAQQFLQGIFLPKLFIPGNHDQYTGRAFRQKRFYQSFANKRKHLEHRSEFFTLKEHGIEAHQLSDEWWCIALDTAKPTSLFSSNGEFTERHETYLEEMLSLLPPKSSILLFNHFPFFQNDHPKRWLKGGEKLRAFLEKHPEIRLYLHGHTHRHVIADLRESSLPILLDSGCPIQKQSATWNLLNLEKDHCTVTGYRHNGKEWVPFTEQFFSWEKRYG